MFSSFCMYVSIFTLSLAFSVFLDYRQGASEPWSTESIPLAHQDTEQGQSKKTNCKFQPMILSSKTQKTTLKNYFNFVISASPIKNTIRLILLYLDIICLVDFQSGKQRGGTNILNNVFFHPQLAIWLQLWLI